MWLSQETLPSNYVILTLGRRQLFDVIHGLDYLHQYNLVHGNLTAVSGIRFIPSQRIDTFTV